MIVAYSQFKVANGMEAEVRNAFLNRPGRVDDKPGFLGMEVFTDCADPSVFYLITRWTDLGSYESWHGSASHHTSHEFIPQGLKLDPKSTRILQMSRLADPLKPTDPADQMRDLAPLLARFVGDSGSLHLAILGTDGTIESLSPAFFESLGQDSADFIGGSIWRCLVEPDGRRLRELIESGARRTGDRERFNFVDVSGHPFTLECHLDVQPGRVVLIGEPPAASNAEVQSKLLELSKELGAINRENVRQNRELARAKEQLEKALKELRESSWHLKKIQEFLPICYHCHKVRIPEGEGEERKDVWMNLMNYLNENAIVFSHGLCPECFEMEMADILAASPKDDT